MSTENEDKDGIFGDDDEGGFAVLSPGEDEHGEFDELEEDFDELPPEETAEPVETATPVDTPEAKKNGKAARKPSAPKNTTAKPIRDKMTPRKKTIRTMLRDSGLDGVPELATLMTGKTGTNMRIRDIAVFIEEPENEVLKGVHNKCPRKNTINLSAKVTLKRVVMIGKQVFSAERMFQPIQVASIKRDGDDENTAADIQCSSGRHRLAFLALVYGPDVEIPVYLESMTLEEARDAVVVANQARPTKALEKAEHAVLRAVSGNADAPQDEIYRKMVKKKAAVPKYCTYSVVERQYPKALEFPVSNSPSRSKGELTTVSNLNGFWTNASKWNTDTKRAEFDKYLTEMADFLNALADAMQKEDDFEPKRHMSAMTMQAMGKCYKTICDRDGKPPKAAIISKAVFSLGDELGRQRAEATYDALMEAIRA